MKEIKQFKNIYSKGKACIEKGYIAPYDNAPYKEEAYRTICKDKYGFIYHISVFPTLEKAVQDLENLAFYEVKGA